MTVDASRSRQRPGLSGGPNNVLADVPASAVGPLVAASCDLALILDPQRIVRNVTLTDADVDQRLIEGWIGKSVFDTVTAESRPKIDRLLAASGPTVTGPAHVNHPREGHSDLPVRYSAADLGAERTILVGRDLSPIASAQRRVLAAQRNAERSLERLRVSEARYRQYFYQIDEPVVFVDANDRISEANPAAARLVDAAARLVGRKLGDLVATVDRKRLAEGIERARLGGAGTRVPLTDGLALVAPLRAEPNAVLVRLIEQDAVASPEVSRAARVFEALPDGVVVTDTQFAVIACNRSFLDMSECASLDQVLGMPIDRWLGRPGVDVGVVRNALAGTGILRGFASVVRGDLGRTLDVDISAARVPPPDGPQIVLVVRPAASPVSMLTPPSAQRLADLVGRVPMKEIVRETTDTIERLCIEAALEISSDNRASAAELLGLSRQSLYVKMRRFGIVEGESGDPPEQG